jgi:16S rRNA (guanine966-N2)-methyltransferase
MRVIAGIFGKRIIQSPRGYRTHPMSERIRSALFNSLGSLEDMQILDAFAGSGALGLEALSRGAKYVQFVERDRHAYKTIKENMETLAIENAKATRANVSTWLDNNGEVVFDLIFVDPPYNDTQPHILKKMVPHLSHDGTLVLSWPGSDELPFIAGLHLYKHRSYGDGQIGFYEIASSHAKATA